MFCLPLHAEAAGRLVIEADEPGGQDGPEFKWLTAAAVSGGGTL